LRACAECIAVQLDARPLRATEASPQESDQLIAESWLMRKRVKERLTTTENEELFPSEVHGARAASGEEG
jgi:hypothetical protein